MRLLRPQVTAIGSDGHGRGHVLGIDVAGTESYDSWLQFLKTIRERGVSGVVPVASDAHEGLKGAIRGTSRGAAWQRCVVHLMRDCVREATSQQLRRHVARIVTPVFRARDAGQVRATYHPACEMLERCRPKAAKILGETYHTLVAKTQRQAERARDALIVELGSWEVRLPPASPCATSWPRSCATRRTPAPSSPPRCGATAPRRASSAATSAA